MKISGLGFGLLLASLTPLSAQVTVEVTQEQNDFLPGESVPVAVRITNRSGQTLHLGAEPDWLTFNIEGGEGGVVSKLGDAPVAGEFELESSRVAIKHVDLAPYFALNRTGRYGIVAVLKIKNWGQAVESRPKYFDVVEGATLWEQEVGVPRGADATGGTPELRKYVLQQANYLKGHLRLYLRVTDDYGRILRVANVGQLVSFSRPEPQVDHLNRLHLLFQNGPSSFSYHVFDLNGAVVAHQTYDYVSTRPRLRMDDEGNVVVQGGTRRVSASDIPPPTPEELEKALHPPEPPAPATNSAKAGKHSKK